LLALAWRPKIEAEWHLNAFQTELMALNIEALNIEALNIEMHVRASQVAGRA